MLFLNPWLLLGLAGVAIPIVIHLVRQQAAKPIDWGAMRFLFDTVAVRRRRMEWEDLLLMAARCLLLGLLALAVARPFITPDSGVPWLLVLPAALLGIALFGASFVLGGVRPRWIVRGLALALVLLAAALVIFEKVLHLKRFEATGRRDVALVIDASSSMQLRRADGKSVFEAAMEEARKLVAEAPRGTAFSVILGGPAPQAVTATPLSHRADVLGVLDGLQAIGGTFRAHEALGMATLGLAQGSNATKEIVVFTDAQRAGWRYDDPGAWKSLAAAWAKLPSRPKLLIRSFGAPAPFHNACLADLQTSRAVVGTDREVTLRATISNTGTSALTPGVVTLEIDGQEMKNQSVGLLAPGQSQAVEFSHRFTRPGPQVVVLRIAPQDDLASDDRVERVVAVRGKLPVLLVDGYPAGSFFERAAGYPALALAPSAALIAGKPPGEGFLMDPRVVAAPALAEADLESAAVIVLADVARLPARLAGKLADRVAGGAGLLVLAGPRTQPDFYNGWQGADGPLCPAPLSGETADPEGVAPAAATFRHESLKSFGDQSDLTSATLRRWWTSAEPVAGAVQAAAFGNGDAFLVSRPYGRGRVLLATCAFDARSGNLPARQSFVPLMHELVTWAAGGGIDLNVSAAWSPSIRLGSSSGEPAGDSPETLQATDPAGAPREVLVRKGRELAVSGPAVPGVYQIQNHASLAAAIDGLGTGKLPFVVTREAAESGFEPLGEADMELMRRHADVLLPGSVADLLAVLEGRGFGREIWKLLAGAAMVLFLLESVLARWVAKSRGTAEDSHVEFGETALWRGGQR